MRYQIAAIAVISVALGTTAALAQESVPVVTTVSTPSFPFSPPEAAHGWSSTALEGYLRGRAVLTRAQGDKNLLDAQALLKLEEARAVYLENRVQFVKDQHEIKDIKRQYREQEQQRLISRRLQAKQLRPVIDLQVAKDYQLNEFEFDSTTGAISWPSEMASPRYAAYRHRIEMLMLQMIQYDLFDDDFYRSGLAEACDRLSDQLHTDAKAEGRLRDARYHEAVRFVLGLKYTPHLLAPVDIELIAMNR